MRPLSIVLLASLLFHNGCSRSRYRLAAESDSYSIIREKSACMTEKVSEQYSVLPDVRSRFYDPTNPDCPRLPTPKPVLNGYKLPELASDSGPCPRDYFCSSNIADNRSGSLLSVKSSDKSAVADMGMIDVESTRVQAAGPIQPLIMAVVPASFEYPPIGKPAQQLELEGKIGLHSPGQERAQVDPEPGRSQPSDADSQRTLEGTQNQNNPGSSFNRPISKQAWESLPKPCIDRMLEFSSIRAEYARSFPNAELATGDLNQRKVNLANLMELASINSRNYQAVKEQLFIAALALTRERYQYELNPLQFGNGTAADYRHRRVDGATTNQLAIPSGIGVQRSLASGGEFLARFANSVVLTFNGPTGFASDISSELIFDFQQTVFQRDIQFERLTQLERNVVYAARDYLRFRKQLFRDIAGQYYNLLLIYRTIEIGSQDYFTNLRGFIQSQSEYRTAEKISRVQVDQFEQNVLRTRGNVINNCFNLESSLDQLKFSLGLPTEMPILVDLTELESISLRDELSVARQMIQRARNELLTAKSSNNLDATTLANVAEVLADRMTNILRIQEQIEQSLGNTEDGGADTYQERGETALRQAALQLEQLRHQLQILGIGMQVEALYTELEQQLKSEVAAPPLLILNRSLEYSEAKLEMIDLALEWSAEKANTGQAILTRQRDELASEIGKLQEFLVEISSQLRSAVDLTQSQVFSDIPKQSQRAIELMKRIDNLATQVTDGVLPRNGNSLTDSVESAVTQTIELSDQLLRNGPDGWEEIVLDHDEALLTALVQRLDLMNQRGRLADSWRQIKLAGDDLRSIMNLGAQQRIGTRTNSDNPVDFSFENSETRLTASLDTPLNRRLQRNNFRVALINYNLGLRNLMALEDSIKQDVREDLRQLALDRTQYSISVASAALAYERVISTRLRLQLAVQNVAARDFLEAQQAYANALNSIARQHVNYITDRLELFFDLEAIDVDSCGYWQGITSDTGPAVNLDFPGHNPRPYDTLPPHVRYSPTIRQMEKIPPGEVEIR